METLEKHSDYSWQKLQQKENNNQQNIKNRIIDMYRKYVEKM